MPQSAGSAPVRLEIRVGEVAVCGSRLVRIRAMAADGLVGIEDLITGAHSDVSLADLRSRPTAVIGTQIDVQLEAVRSAPDGLWQRATIRENALTALLEGSGSLAARAKEVATQHKISVRTLYRWLARYRDAAQTSALIAHVRGVRTGARRLDIDRERLVNKIIEQKYLSRSRPSVEEIVRIVHQRCLEGHWKPVSRNAIRARINQLDPRTRTRTRLGRAPKLSGCTRKHNSGEARRLRSNRQCRLGSDFLCCGRRLGFRRRTRTRSPPPMSHLNRTPPLYLASGRRVQSPRY